VPRRYHDQATSLPALRSKLRASEASSNGFEEIRPYALSIFEYDYAAPYRL